ncbi:MAG: DUF1003 domain-containing protein [Bacilli bacterium]|nr:DUF1003 domain-containing protein [Bacilli bacterium]
MNKDKHRQEVVKMVLNDKMNKKEKEELLDVLVDQPLAIDVDKQEENKLSFGDKLADRLSEIAGSWVFIIMFVSFLLFWIILNTTILTKENQIDKFPFVLLNLLLSCLSALQAPIIMMSQNRQSKKDSLRNKNDYKVDLKSELILEELHDKIELVLKEQQIILNRIKQIKKSGEKNEKDD